MSKAVQYITQELRLVQEDLRKTYYKVRRMGLSTDPKSVRDDLMYEFGKEKGVRTALAILKSTEECQD